MVTKEVVSVYSTECGVLYGIFDARWYIGEWDTG